MAHKVIQRAMIEVTDLHDGDRSEKHSFTIDYLADEVHSDKTKYDLTTLVAYGLLFVNGWTHQDTTAILKKGSLC